MIKVKHFVQISVLTFIKFTSAVTAVSTNASNMNNICKSLYRSNVQHINLTYPISGKCLIFIPLENIRKLEFSNVFSGKRKRTLPEMGYLSFEDLSYTEK